MPDKEHSLAWASKLRAAGALFCAAGEDAPSARLITKEIITMQPLHPSTHRLRCSQPQPAAHPLPIMDDRDTAQKLLCSVSVLPEQAYDPLVQLANRQPKTKL